VLLVPKQESAPKTKTMGEVKVDVISCPMPQALNAIVPVLALTRRFPVAAVSPARPSRLTR
jgi:hypothetical protein